LKKTSRGLSHQTIKFHGCQTENIEIKNCQSLTDKIDTSDQKDDLKLGVVDIDRQTDLYNVYDQQITFAHFFKSLNYENGQSEYRNAAEYLGRGPILFAAIPRR
jgi:hypothetical protein